MIGGEIWGDFSKQKIGLNQHYFIERGIILDCRGTVEISAHSYWGFQIMVLTASHIHDGKLGRMVLRKVVVEDFAWICSRALLYNCRIGKGSIVAAGSVVRSMDIPEYTMVAGNPAVVIGKFNLEISTWIDNEGWPHIEK